VTSPLITGLEAALAGVRDNLGLGRYMPCVENIMLDVALLEQL